MIRQRINENPEVISQESFDKTKPLEQICLNKASLKNVFVFAFVL